MTIGRFWALWFAFVSATGSNGHFASRLRHHLKGFGAFFDTPGLVAPGRSGTSSRPQRLSICRQISLRRARERGITLRVKRLRMENNAPVPVAGRKKFPARPLRDAANGRSMKTSLAFALPLLAATLARGGEFEINTTSGTIRFFAPGHFGTAVTAIPVLKPKGFYRIRQLP
jgi:hypothetical protein